MTNSSAIATQLDWATGVHLDRYEILGEIARGGMGTVLLARLAGAGGFSRLFALKVLHRHLAGDEHFVHMLLDEAHLASRIHHSNVVPVLDVCHNEQGLYVVMEYVDGFPFSAILASPAFSVEERVGVGLPVLLGVLAGLEAAHNLVDDDGAPLGLVHRDVSPQNVLVGIDGVARVADFGIAQAAARLSHTEPGTIKGKLCYLAPESIRGAVVDRRADVFCAGIMLWETLVGRRLFKADNDAATLLKVLEEPIVPPSRRQGRSSAALDGVCMKALERDPAKRYPSARHMAAALASACEQAGGLISPLVISDLLRARFGAELARRQERLRGRGSAPKPLPPGVNVNGARPPSLSGANAAGARPPSLSGANAAGARPPSLPGATPPPLPASAQPTVPMPHLTGANAQPTVPMPHLAASMPLPVPTDFIDDDDHPTTPATTRDGVPRPPDLSVVSLPLHITVETMVGHVSTERALALAPRRGRGAVAVVGALLLGALGLAAVWLHHAEGTQPAPAAVAHPTAAAARLPAVAAPATAVEHRAASERRPAATGVDVAHCPSPAAAGAPVECAAPRDGARGDEHRSSHHHHHGKSGGEPALEMNPYL